MHPSPQRVDKSVLGAMEEVGNRNSVISLHIQQRLHALMAQAPYWYLPKSTRAQLRQMQGAAFDGCYPLQEDRMEVIAGVSARRNEHSGAVMAVLQDVELFIEEQEDHWKKSGYTGDMLRMHQEIDATDQLAKRLGGRVLMFGSARKEQSSPEYPGAKWLSQMITQHFVQEDGHGEQVITGAGPGIMQAANEGALHGSWNALKKMQTELLDTKGNARQEIVQRMLNQRLQMTSIGVRVQLPFEAGWNDHLHGNLTIKSFVPRKMTLISTAVGRSVSHSKETKVDWHGRHPAVFVLTGGFGTMDEMWDVACLEQCRKMPDMPMFIVGKPMREVIEASLEVMEREGTVSPKDRNFFRFCEDELDALFQYADHYSLPISDELRRDMRSHKPIIGTIGPAAEHTPLPTPDPRLKMVPPARIDLDKIIADELQKQPKVA